MIVVGRHPIPDLMATRLVANLSHGVDRAATRDERYHGQRSLLRQMILPPSIEMPRSKEAMPVGGQTDSATSSYFRSSDSRFHSKLLLS
jgi:hypothetical protein